MDVMDASDVVVPPWREDTAAINILREGNFNVNYQDEDGRSPLFAAAEDGHADTVSTLLDCGADANVSDLVGATPLYTATENGHVEVVRLLLGRGAAVAPEPMEENGRTPLSIACHHGRLEVVRILLDHGANVERAANGGAIPLLIATLKCRLEIAKLLLDRGADANMADDNGLTSLHVACENCHFGLVGFLLDRGADVNVTANDSGETPLSITSDEGDLAIARLLLDRGAIVDRTRNDGASPLFIACQEGRLEIVRLLLVRGANVSLADNDGETPLMCACWFGRTAIARLFLEHGADPAAVAHATGCAALHAAAELASVDVMRLLIDRGPDSLWRRNIDSFYCWAVVAKRSRPAPRDHVEGLPSFYHAAELRKHVWSFVKLPPPADVNFSDAFGQTALMYAACGGVYPPEDRVDAPPRPDADAYVRAVRFLVTNGARLDIQDDQGRTALQMADSESSLLDADGKRLMRDTLRERADIHAVDSAMHRAALS